MAPVEAKATEDQMKRVTSLKLAIRMIILGWNIVVNTWDKVSTQLSKIYNISSRHFNAELLHIISLTEECKTYNQLIKCHTLSLIVNIPAVCKAMFTLTTLTCCLH